MVDGCTEVGGVPGDGGVGEHGEALGLDRLVVGPASVESAEVGEEQLAADGVEGFAFVELLVDSSSVVFVVEVAEDGGNSQTDAFCTFARFTPP